MLIDDLNTTINLWLNDLQTYSLEELLAKPDPHGWSLGQVYMHLIEETTFYLEQMESCLKYDDHAHGEMDERGKAMFANNSFPNERIKGDPFISEKVAQPENKQRLEKDMLRLKQELNEMGIKVTSSQTIGKTPHPGHGYFSASEWLQYAEMHMRHHLKQKKRLDERLKLDQRPN